MPDFSFYGCFPGVVEPVPADPTLEGAPPFRAVSWCEPFRAASGYGWYSFPAFDCHVKWNGDSFSLKPAGGEWQPLQHFSVADACRVLGQEPPDDITVNLPVFAGLQEHGVLQIWTGLIARTAPGWHLLVRGVPNGPGSLTYEVLEGIIETDWWHGPLVSNLRFRKTDEPVRLHPRRPLLAIQPVRREAVQAHLRNGTEFHAHAPGGVKDAVVDELVASSLSYRREGVPGGYRAETSRRRRDRDAADHA
jgi:hypothetical protein